MSSSNTFNFGEIKQEASGAGSVNQVGNNTATTSVGNLPVPTIPQVFDAMESALSEIKSDEGNEEINQSVLMPLQSLAELPTSQHTPDVMEQAQSLINRLVPYAPSIGKGLAVFGQAALSSLASSNPIMAGILAVCKMAGQ